MDEFMKKLALTGDKALDLINRGLDKLPDGMEQMLQALEYKYRILGILGLLGGFLLVLFLIVCWVLMACRKNKKEDWSGMVMFCSLGAFVPIGMTLFNVNVWMMAINPRAYVLSHIGEALLKL